jgi:type IV secretion system protein VirB5
MSKLMFQGMIVMALICAAAAPASAQWAVVDAPAIVQLIQEVKEMEQEVQTAESQLNQARQALATMTGDRGMELLLSGITRNYLPANWSQLAGAMTGSGLGSSALTASIRSAIGSNAVLTPQQLALLSPANQRQIAAARQAYALQQSLAQAALTNSSARFASIQSLIAAISTASDQKGILDLQARISAELGMLQNEQTKLQVLRQTTDAQSAVMAQQERERIIAAQGNFDTRFQPTP